MERQAPLEHSTPNYVSSKYWSYQSCSICGRDLDSPSQEYKSLKCHTTDTPHSMVPGCHQRVFCHSPAFLLKSLQCIGNCVPHFFLGRNALLIFQIQMLQLNCSSRSLSPRFRIYTPAFLCRPTYSTPSSRNRVWKCRQGYWRHRHTVHCTVHSHLKWPVKASMKGGGQYFSIIKSEHASWRTGSPSNKAMA